MTLELLSANTRRRTTVEKMTVPRLGLLEKGQAIGLVRCACS